MLYLVGGSPRAGKSTIARKFLSQTGVPYFGLDYLKMGLARGLPEYGVDLNNDDRITAQKLWPVVKGIGYDVRRKQRGLPIRGGLPTSRICGKITSKEL